MTTQHTPGPWVIDKHAVDQYSIYSKGASRVHAFVTAGETNSLEENAQLIAVAPELLEALKQCKYFMDAAYDLGVLSMKKDSEGYTKMCAAINKAEGK